MYIFAIAFILTLTKTKMSENVNFLNQQNQPNFNHLAKRCEFIKRKKQQARPFTCQENQHLSINPLSNQQEDFIANIQTFGNWKKNKGNVSSRLTNRFQLENYLKPDLSINALESSKKQFLKENERIQISKSKRHGPIFPLKNKMLKDFFIQSNDKEEANERYSKRRQSMDLLKQKQNELPIKQNELRKRRATIDLNGTRFKKDEENQREPEKEKFKRMYNHMKQGYQSILQRHGIQQTIEENQYCRFLLQ